MSPIVDEGISASPSASSSRSIRAISASICASLTGRLVMAMRRRERSFCWLYSSRRPLFFTT